MRDQREGSEARGMNFSSDMGGIVLSKVSLLSVSSDHGDSEKETKLKCD